MTEKFRGRYSIKVDSKGRLAWPAPVRETLGQRTKLIFTNGIFKGVPHLDIYTLKAWENLENEIDRLPALRPEVQAFQRFYLASGTPGEVDGQGRVLIPYELRDYAQLKNDIMVVGMGSRLEIWDRALWQKVFSTLKKDYDGIMAAIANLKGEDKK
jgi:MraZ protein